MSVIFFHKRNTVLNKDLIPCISALGGETIAMEELKPWFVSTVKVGDFFDARIGHAKCSNEDRYCKKIGREFATRRIKTVSLTVETIFYEKNLIRLLLADKNGNKYLVLKYNNANSVFLVDYDKE